MKIMLIAGHGGTPYDAGACANGYREAVETRRMANAVAPLLRKYGFEVVLYDQSQDAFKVVKKGGSLPLGGVDYALEFHLNAAANDHVGDGRTTGSEIFVHTTEAQTGVEAAILQRLAALGFKNRGVKKTDKFAVLKHVKKRGVSHALIETCFIDDKDDMTLYSAKFDAIARAIADGVADGFGEKGENEMVQKKQILIDGKAYECECIEKDGNNFIKMRSLSQAGYTIDYNGMPVMLAPQRRALVPAPDADTQAALDKIKTICGLSDDTMQYLQRYQYGDDLVHKIAAPL